MAPTACRIFVCTALCMVVIAAHPSAFIVQVAGCLAFVILGAFGGAAHWAVACSLSTSTYLARFISFAYAGGLLIQFMANNTMAILIGAPSLALVGTPCS